MPALSFWISLKRLSASVITLQLNDKWRSFPEMFANRTLPQARDETKVFCFSSSRTWRSEFHYGFDFVQCMPLFDVVSRSLGRLRSLRNGNRTQGPPPLSGGKARERRSTCSPWRIFRCKKSCRRWNLWSYKCPACLLDSNCGNGVFQNCRDVFSFCFFSSTLFQVLSMLRSHFQCACVMNSAHRNYESEKGFRPNAK